MKTTLYFLAVSLYAQTHNVEIVAGADDAFHLPGNAKVLHLKSGEPVHFKIDARFGGEKSRDGSVHSFVVKSLRDKGWDVRLKPGIQEFDLTAPPAGEYLVECTVKCGPGHESMNFKILVE